MIKLLSLALLVFALVVCVAPGVFAHSCDYVEGEVIVKFKSGVSATVLRSSGEREADTIRVFSSLSAESGKQIALVRSEAKTTEQLMAEYGDMDNVESVTPNHYIYATSTPNDTYFGDQWGLHNTGQSGGTYDADIDAPEAWNLRTGAGSTVYVAVIDSGINYDHPDLAANVWSGKGYDFVNDDSDPADDYGHGTFVAGVIGAVGNNGRGVSGVNWSVRMIALKVLNGSGSGTVSDEIEAIEWITQKKRDGMNIVAVNASYAGYSYNALERSAIEELTGLGVLFVAAAGNDGTNNDGATPAYPASHNLAGIISVAASTRNDTLWSSSNYGSTAVDLAAPGASIWSTYYPGTVYTSSSGTSAAAPFVTGAVAMLAARFSSDSSTQRKARILDNVDTKWAFSGKCVTGGRLNLYKAMGGSTNGGGGGGGGGCNGGFAPAALLFAIPLWFLAKKK